MAQLKKGDTMRLKYKSIHKKDLKIIAKYTWNKTKQYAPISIAIILIISGLAAFEIAREHHMKKYKDPGYVCHHMARDLEDMLESVGISVTIVTGQNFSAQTGHAWIQVFGMDIDSVSLLTKNNRKRYPDEIKEFDDYSIWAKYFYSDDIYKQKLNAGEL